MAYWPSSARRVTVLRATLAALLRRKLGSLTDPELRMMTDVAEADYLNYVKVKRGLLGLSDSTLTAAFIVEETFEDKPVEAACDVSEWLDLWLVKWRQRVRLALSPTKEDLEAQKMEQKVEPVFRRLKYLNELKDIVIGSLVEAGEVCFTELLAESLIKSSLARMLRETSDPARLLAVLDKNPYVLLNDVLRQVKRIKRYKGPLVTVWIKRVIGEVMVGGYGPLR